MAIDPDSGVTRIEPLSNKRTPTCVPFLIPAATAIGAGRRRPREFPHLQIAVMIDPFKAYSQCIQIEVVECLPSQHAYYGAPKQLNFAERSP